jgi:Transglycosylase SLT domain
MRPAAIASLLAIALALPATANAAEPARTATVPTPATPTNPTTTPITPTTTPATTTTTTTTTTTAEGEASAPSIPTTPGPEAQEPQVQSVTPSGRPSGSDHTKTGGGRSSTGGSGATRPGTGAHGAAGTSNGQAHGSHSAPSPKTLTPALPLNLGGPLSGVGGFFVESFQIPPFLLPIYQAAGTAYGIPWQVLAAINEVETDYGRDLSVSSAGAEGWMQFLPSTWVTYGVDATGAGYRDPYNPADAIFAAARYLRAAGGAKTKNIRAAVYAYNHSQAYVDSVMLRAQLLGSTPPELLGAVTGLTESQFPVHAPAHFSDGFETVPAGPTASGASGSGATKTLAGTTIYSQAGAPVVAVQDGEVVQIGDSPTLGHYIALRDAYGNTYVYAQLGSVATLYPVLEPHEHTAVSARIAASEESPQGSKAEPAPSSPATAGAQARSPLSAGATVSGFALGAAAGLEPAPAIPTPPRAGSTSKPPTPAPPTPRDAREFRSGPDDVYLHELHTGVQVLAGTVLGHVGAQASGAGVPGSASPGTGVQSGEPHMFFQIKPAGVGAPLIDPKPILDGWVALENTSIFRARGENPFLQTSPTVGQVLLESKQQLQQQVARDRSIHMRACEREGVQTGHVDRPVLAMLEYLSVSGLKPTVTGLHCVALAPASESNASASPSETVRITAIDGTPIAGHQGPGSTADTTIRKLLMLQGLDRPRRIVSVTPVPGAKIAFVRARASAYIAVAFGPRSARAHAASAPEAALTPREWVKLIARLGEIPDPTVASGPSSAAIPDTSGTPIAPGESPASGTGTGTGTGSNGNSESEANGHG